jgi:hypothetical protein
MTFTVLRKPRADKSQSYFDQSYFEEMYGVQLEAEGHPGTLVVCDTSNPDNIGGLAGSLSRFLNKKGFK